MLFFAAYSTLVLRAWLVCWRISFISIKITADPHSQVAQPKEIGWNINSALSLMPSFFWSSLIRTVPQRPSLHHSLPLSLSCFLTGPLVFGKLVHSHICAFPHLDSRTQGSMLVTYSSVTVAGQSKGHWKGRNNTVATSGKVSDWEIFMFLFLCFLFQLYSIS